MNPGEGESSITQSSNTQGTGRTVDQFYTDVANTNATTSENLQSLSNREPVLYGEIKSGLNEVKALSDEKLKIPFYNIGEKKRVDEELAIAKKTYTGLIQESQQIPRKIEETRAPAVGYTGDIASNETVIRATNPARLQELIDANKPLPGQEAPVRIADLTPQQVEKRRSDAAFAKETRDIWYSAENDSSRLPEDKRTQEEKDRDSDEAQEQAESVAVEVLTSNLLKEMNENNAKIPEGQKKWEISNPEVVRTFAEYAYHMGTSEFGVPTEMLREGYVSIERRIFELKRSTPSGEILGEIENLQYFSKRVKAIEDSARFSMAMWQISNEINSAVNGSQLPPEDFLLNLTSAKVAISQGESFTRNTGSNFKAIMENYSRFSPGLASEVGLQYFTSEYYHVPMRISEFTGHRNPADLNREDVPKILAYLGAMVESNEKTVKNRGFIGVDIALKVALREIDMIRTDHISFNTVLERTRPNLRVEEAHKNLGMITREYASLLDLSGKDLELQQAFGRKIW